jgi:hypothetical protein
LLHGAATRKSKVRQAEILREYGPYPGMQQIHGVTFNGAHVWFARSESIVALDPEGDAPVRELAVAADAVPSRIPRPLGPRA